MSDRLIDRWVSGTASAEDRAELIELIEADPTLVKKIFLAAEHDGLLRDYFGVMPKITLEPPQTVRPNTRTYARQRARLRLSRWLPLGVSAAAVLFFAILIINVMGSKPNPHSDNTPSVVTPEQKTTPTDKPTDFVIAPPAKNPAFPKPAYSKDIPLPPLKPQNDNVQNSQISNNMPVTNTTEKPTLKPEPQIAQVIKPQPVSGYIRLDGELKNNDNALIMRYALHIPATLPATKQLGLVLAFHGAGGNEKRTGDPILAALQQHDNNPNMVVAALKSAGENWTADDENNIISFINWALETYPIDRRRIVIQGTSNGGWLVNYFGSRHPELIAGVVAVCGGNGFQMPTKKPLNAAETGFEYYIAHGTADVDVEVKHARGVAESLRQNGYRYVYREYPGVGHNVYADKYTRNDFAAWLSRLRHKTMPLSDDDTKALAAYKKTDQAEALLLTKAGGETLIRIGGLPVEKILARAIRSKNPAVRARAIHLFAQTSCMPGASTLIASGLDDKDAAVRIAAINTLSRIGDWNDQDALIALCRFAGDRKSELSERVMTVTALTESIALRCSPTVSNQLIYELLVHLLDDDEETLRTLAFSTLKKLQNDHFGYDAQLPAKERREPVIAWRRWYIELFNPTPAKP